jgi:eukaryotic-like serine/threonine-protein kinase
MIAFPCPGCGVQLKVKDELGGRLGKCPGCGRAVQVPPAGTPSAHDNSTDHQRPAGKRPSGETNTVGGLVPATNSDARPTSVVEFSFLTPPLEPDEIGRLGPYRILSLLGSGSMGIVFRAEDSRLKRPVALKVMRPNYATKEEYRQRFLREAQATAKLDHPHVVPIYGVDEFGGAPYLAMKLLEGESLEERLKARGSWLPLAEVLRIGEEVSDALAAAHARELIHRDVKPTNIWLESGGDRVKLIDFGLARILDDDLRLTGTGYVVGTPSYMAPEQANGDEVDHRSDLFSLGCVLYRASTGVQPFPGQFAVDVVAAVRTLDPKPPRGLDPTLPPSFSDLVMALLCKDPAGRPQSALAVRDTLHEMRAVVAGSSRPASNSNLPKPPSKPLLPATTHRRSRWAPTLVLAAAFVVFGALLALAARFLWYAG